MRPGGSSRWTSRTDRAAFTCGAPELDRYRPHCSDGWRSGEAKQGRGLGAFLLMNALHRVLLASQTLAVHAMIVDARDDAAAAFYRKYGFIPFADDARQLLLPMATLRQLLAS